MERERELATLRRQHERQIYMLKRKLHETSLKKKISGGSNAGNPAAGLDEADPLTALTVSIPNFTLSGLGSNCHVEYQVNLKTLDAQWAVIRRFRQFRDLHMAMITMYGPMVTALPFPSRRIFGSRSEHVSGERQRALTTYLNVLLLTLVKVESCPIYKNPSKSGLLKLSAFFHEDAKEATETVVS